MSTTLDTTPQNQVDKDDLPTSFGAFKPVGHVMLGLQTPEQVAQVTAALKAAGWADGAIVPFAPRESVAELKSLIENASGLAGFGYEITLMRRYLDLARQGCHWLLVHAEETEAAEQVGAIARQHGALLAVHYRKMTIDELI